jgi:hypothetical protein
MLYTVEFDVWWLSCQKIGIRTSDLWQGIFKPQVVMNSLCFITPGRLLSWQSLINFAASTHPHKPTARKLCVAWPPRTLYLSNKTSSYFYTIEMVSPVMWVFIQGWSGGSIYRKNELCAKGWFVGQGESFVNDCSGYVEQHVSVR